MKKSEEQATRHHVRWDPASSTHAIQDSVVTNPSHPNSGREREGGAAHPVRNVEAIPSSRRTCRTKTRTGTATALDANPRGEHLHPRCRSSAHASMLSSDRITGASPLEPIGLSRQEPLPGPRTAKERTHAT